MNPKLNELNGEKKKRNYRELIFQSNIINTILEIIYYNMCISRVYFINLIKDVTHHLYMFDSFPILKYITCFGILFIIVQTSYLKIKKFLIPVNHLCDIQSLIYVYV